MQGFYYSINLPQRHQGTKNFGIFILKIYNIYPQEIGFPHWHRLGSNQFKEYIPQEWVPKRAREPARQVIPISGRYSRLF